MAITTEELRQLSADELQAKLREGKEELFNLRFQAATGQLESHGRLGAVRKEIARIYTIIRERELGIGGAAMADKTEDRGFRKTREGIVVSDKMDKTITVEVSDRVSHGLYSKVMSQSRKLKAHDEKNEAGTGDRVLIMLS